MHYAITRSVMGFEPEIMLTLEEYERLREAKRGIVFALGVEERFNIVRENYREYEAEVFTIAQRSVMYFTFEWLELVPELFSLNRRLLNFLSAARLYREHLSWELPKICGPGSLVAQRLGEAWDREKRDSLAFRFMEALRNHTQHYALPVYSIDHPNRAVEEGGVRRIEHGAVPKLSLSKFAEDDQVKPRLIEELRPYADRKGLVPINAFIRDYLQALGRVQRDIREAIGPTVAGWDGQVLGAIGRGEQVFGQTQALVFGQYYDDEDDELACPSSAPEEDLFADPIQRRQQLERLAGHAHMMPDAKDYISTD